MSEKVTRRRFLKGLAVAVGSSALAACAPKVVKETVVVEKPIEKVVKETVIVEGTPQVVEKVVTVTPVPPEPAEIRVASWHGDFWNPICEAISKTYPHITAIPESAPRSEYQTKLLTQMAGGVAPDVPMMDSKWWYPMLDKGLLMPLDDALAGHGIDNYKWDADPWKQCGYKGKIYTLSQIYCPTWELLVNKAMAEEEGIKLPEWGDDGPAEGFDEWHWDDLVELVKAMTKVTSSGEVERYGLGTPTGNLRDSFSFQALVNYLYDVAGDLFDDPWAFEETETFIDSPEAIQMAQDYLDLTLVHKAAPMPAEASAVQGGLFRAKKCFCEFRHPGVGYLKNWENKEEVAFLPLPWIKQRIKFMGTNGWSVWKQGKNTDAAATFAVFATTNDEIADWITGNINLTAYDMRRAIDKLPPLPEGWMRKMYEVMLCRDDRFSRYRPSTENVKWMPRWWGRQSQLFQDTLAREYEKVLLGEKTMEAALRQVKEETNATLRES